VIKTWIPNHYDRAKEKFLSSKAISEQDKSAVTALIDKLLATKIKYSRAEKYYLYLRLIIERGYLHSFHDVTQDALYHTLSIIEHNTGYGSEAKRDYKIFLKRVLEHLNNPLATQIKTTSARAILPRFFLTVHDILKICQCNWPHFRDKAMLACLYESNCRPHEFFMLKREDIRFETIPAKMANGNGTPVSVSLDIAYLTLSPESKTGARVVSLFFTVPWLKAWLKMRNYTYVQSMDSVESKNCTKVQDDHVWVDIRGGRRGQHIKYETARKAVKQIAKAAGIERWNEVQLYTSRRGRNTELSQILSYSQHCKQAGWQQDSDMPAVYNQVHGIDLTGALLSPYGITIDHHKNEKQAWIEIMGLGLEFLKKMK